MTPDSNGEMLAVDGANLSTLDPNIAAALATGSAWAPAVTCTAGPSVSSLSTAVAGGASPSVATRPSTTTVNWAGYVVNNTGSVPAYVEGTWVLHAVTGQAGDSDAVWAGVGNSDLIQLGTLAKINSDLTKTYSAWWELVPGLSIQIWSGFNPPPSDSITASLVFESGRAYFTFNDTTKKKVLTMNHQAAPPDPNQAECIDERVASGGGYANLANFGVQYIYDCYYHVTSGSNVAIPAHGTAINCVSGA